MKRRVKPDIVYVHHGAQRVYDTVIAIAEGGHSCRLICGYYYRQNGLFERLLNLLPEKSRNRILGRLRRRHHGALSERDVERSLLQDVLYVIEEHLSYRFPGIIMIRNWYIDVRAALRVLVLRPRMVIVCDTHALYTLRAAKRVGAVAVLEQIIGHIRTGDRLLREERDRHPQIDSSYRAASNWQLRRSTAEALEAQHVIAPSEYVKQSLLDVGVNQQRIFVLPYGADLKKFGRPEPPPDAPFRILFAGHIGLRKGVYYLLEAMRRANLPDTELVLLGKIEGRGNWLEPYRDLFTHIDHVPHPEIPEIFASAHIYVFPSLHEGSSVSVYEAMASGLPVIATPNAGSFVRDGEEGYIVPIRDIEALADRMARLHGDPALRSRMEKAARHHAESFTWEAYAARITSIIRQLLG